jgi:hypothetical protein
MKRLTAVALFVGVVAFVPTTSASASPVRVTGIQSAPDMTAGHPGDPCRARDPMTGKAPVGSQTMTGGLIGCWYTDTYNQVQSRPNGQILAIGTEHFVGCLDADHNRTCAGHDPHGSLAFIYAFEATLDKQGNEIRGGCQHPIVSGSGDFKGAKGRINFNDHPTTGTSSYRGRITLAKASSHARATASLARLSLRPSC